MPSTSANEIYTVGWICAIKTEYVAAKAFLDETHQGPAYVSPNDNNNYTLGRIGDHNVVVAVLPNGEYGIANAACVARDMLHSFPNVRIGLMVGIGGGVPTKNDIRLGDIVVSTPGHGQGGVLQYDFGKTIQGEEFVQTGFLNKPPPVLLAAVNGLAADYEMEGHRLEESIDEALGKYPRLRKGYERRKPSSDRLYCSDVVHPTNGEATCEILCGDDQSDSLKLRPERSDEEDNPAIHYGLIASANQLMKDALVRDRLATEKDVLCFEMEAAGLMNHFPCLVIRGICDYSDSHKNKEWQGYAAMAAAAYAKDLLRQVSPASIETERRIVDIVSEIKEKVEDVHTVVRNQRHQAILDWLTPVDYSRQHNDILERREEKTGNWFLDSEKFQTWMKKDKETLFCPGIPGAGKTIMTAIVISHLYQKFANSNTGIAYVYCSFQRQSEQKAEDLIQSLLKQLTQGLSSLPDIVSKLYDQFEKDRIRPSFAEMARALHTVAASYTRVFIIIDALDECNSSGSSRARCLKEIFDLQTRSGANIFATSRNIADISTMFAPGSHFPISAKDEDIEAYLDARVAHLDTEIFEDHFLTQLKPRILEAVDGMFLLARLHMDVLATQNTKGGIKRALESLGKGDNKLHKTYEQAIERISYQEAPSRELAWAILEWIVFSKRPLSTAELQHALATRESTDNMDRDFIPSSRVLQSVCAGLVTIDKESDVVRLDHYTIQEFFLERGRELFPNAARHIAEDCIKYLSFDEFGSGACHSIYSLRDRRETHSLYDYAGKHWGHHAYEASGPCEGLADFLKCEKKIEASAQVFFEDKAFYLNAESPSQCFRYSSPSKNTGMHLAAVFGLQGAVSSLLDVIDPDATDELGHRPLYWAARNGHEAVIKLLLSHRNVDPDARDLLDQTPLHIAAQRGQMNAVKLLLGLGHSHPDLKDISGATPLLLAAEGGHWDVVQVLFDTHRVDLNGRDGADFTVLLYAAKEGNVDMVRLLLLDSKIDVNAKNEDGCAPLLFAAMKGHRTIVELLLGTKRVDVNVKSRYGHAPLLVVAEGGRDDIVQLLLDTNEVEVDAKDASGRTSLLLAAKRGHTSVVQRLLSSNKADVNSIDKYGNNALSFSVKLKHDGVLRMLLDTDKVDVNVKDQDGLTPLLFAAMKGQETMIRLLLDTNKVDVNVKDRRGRTPLLHAANEGHSSVTQLLLGTNKVNVNVEDPSGRAPLVVAARKGNTGVFLRAV